MFTPGLSRTHGVLLGILTACCCVSAPGQQDDSLQKNTALLSEYPDEGELVTRASALAAAGKYVEALSIYDEALEKRPNTVVPLDKTKVRALGIREYVLGRIAAWPEEGKAAYRRRADPLAEHLFQGAKRNRDLEALERLVDQYPFSSVVDDALALIANIRLDAGENVGAADALARLLDREGGADKSVVAARLGLAWARAGRKSALEDLARRMEQERPGAAIQVGGRELPLAEHLKSLLDGVREAPSDAAPLALPAWEMLGGGPAGSRLGESGVELAKAAWADTIGLPRLDGEDEQMMRRTMALVPTAEFRPLFPAVSDGILYVHNGLTLTAYNFFAKQPEKLWQFRAPTPSGEVMFDNRVIFAPMVQDGRVYANLINSVGGEENQLGYVRVKFPFPRRALFAFDAYTGKLLWKVGGKLLADALEENATFASAPTPDGGRLYVGAIKQKLSTDLFQHYVLCIDPATGKVLWSTYVASGGTEINLFNNSTRESLGSPVAVADDALYYCTNHGAIAALDKKSGRIRWTYRYRQLDVRPTRSVYVLKNRLEWVSSPPVVARGVAAVTPTDSDTLYALDTQTGQLRWDRPRGQDVRTMYGAKDATLVLGGERLEMVDIRTGQAVAPPMTDELRGSGRGVIAADGIYVPCQDKLRKVNWDGTWDEASARRWQNGPGDGGNLLVVDGAMVLASQDSLQVFFDRHDQERAILDALARNPDDPAVLYRGALRYLQSGDADHAAELLIRTVARTEKGSRPEDERLHRAARKRLFAVSMEAGRAELEGGRAAKAADHFSAARKYAADVSAHVEASVQLARVRLVRKEDEAAVTEYQRLLLEYGEVAVEGARVFDLARNAIHAILGVLGREPYAAHEAAAAGLLAEARRAGTADAFQKVFRLYPNSRAGEEALFEAATAHARIKRSDEQIAALRQFLRECSESARAPEAHARLVRALEEKGHTSSSGALLRRMIRLFPEAEVEEDGKKITAREFAERRLKSDRYARTPSGIAMSKLASPLTRMFEATDPDFPEGVPLRAHGPPPAAVADLVLMYYAGPSSSAVKALDGKTGKEAWRVPLKTPVRYSAFLEESLLVADDHSVTRVDLRDGLEKWKYESKPRLRGFATSGPLLLFIADDAESRLVALDAVRGAPVWSQPVDGIPASRLYSAGEAVVFTTLNPNRILMYEVETGKRMTSSASFPEGLAAQVIHVGDDVIVLQSEGRFLEAYELPSGKLRWRQPMVRVATRGLEVGPEGIVFMGTQRLVNGGDERLFLMTISLQTGKITKRREAVELGNALFLMLDGEQAVVVSREPDKSVSARGVSLSDFSVRWETPLGGKDATLLPPVLTRDHVVLGAFTEDAQAVKYFTTAWLLDKGGRVVQNMKSKVGYERPPLFIGAAHDRLIFSVDSKVEVYR